MFKKGSKNQNNKYDFPSLNPNLVTLAYLPPLGRTDASHSPQ